MHEEKMNALYELFLDNLLELVKSGQVKASDRAVIRQFLRDHKMADKMPHGDKLDSLAAYLPHFGDDAADDH